LLVGVQVSGGAFVVVRAAFVAFRKKVRANKITWQQAPLPGCCFYADKRKVFPFVPGYLLQALPFSALIIAIPAAASGRALRG
jgi:hypothetical protein